MSNKFQKTKALNYQIPRNILVILIQLFYSFIVQIPFYLYILQIAELVNTDYVLIVYLVPIINSIILFTFQYLLNYYFWDNEKSFKKRDLVKVGIKSSFTVVITFYFTFFFILAWALNGVAPNYFGLIPSDNLVQFGIDYLFSLITVTIVCGSLYFFQLYDKGRNN